VTHIFQYQGMWYWKNGSECSEPIFSMQTARAMGRLLFPGTMLLVHK
jgi:hypothetical protein